MHTYCVHTHTHALMHTHPELKHILIVILLDLDAFSITPLPPPHLCVWPKYFSWFRQDLMLRHGWRTGAIVPELEMETRVVNTQQYAQSLTWLQALTGLLERMQVERPIRFICPKLKNCPMWLFINSAFFSSTFPGSSLNLHCPVPDTICIIPGTFEFQALPSVKHISEGSDTFGKLWVDTQCSIHISLMFPPPLQYEYTLICPFFNVFLYSRCIGTLSQRRFCRNGWRRERNSGEGHIVYVKVSYFS